jgi:AbrB family looped-hinge helix DNA binding protein
MIETESLTKLLRPRARGQITLPAAFRRRLKIGENTILRVTLTGRAIEILPLQTDVRDQALREYGEDEIGRFLKEDRLDARTARKVRRLLGKRA